MAKMSLHKSKHGCVTKQTVYDGLTKAIFWGKKPLISEMPILDTRDLRLTLNFNQTRSKKKIEDRQTSKASSSSTRDCGRP